MIAAAARGLTPEDYIRQRIAIDIALDDDPKSLDAEGIEEDLAAIEEFERIGIGIPWEEVRDWMRSWNSGAELPRPTPRKIR